VKAANYAAAALGNRHPDPMNFFLYIVECADGTYYTGIATDVQRRLLEHNGLKAAKGARYTSARRPVRLVFEAVYASRSEASKEEARIKRLARQQKMQLIMASAEPVARAR
jgi:putative endonuclease